MPKMTRKYNFIDKKTRKEKKKNIKMVSFASKTSAGEPVVDHSKAYHDLFDSMTEITI
tara:strand:- start:569 stop:742 length:174 start_codon:yes stop_codon:yes gene_type:complete